MTDIADENSPSIQRRDYFTPRRSPKLGSPFFKALFPAGTKEHAIVAYKLSPTSFSPRFLRD